MKNLLKEDTKVLKQLKDMESKKDKIIKLNAWKLF